MDWGRGHQRENVKGGCPSICPTNLLTDGGSSRRLIFSTV